MTTSFRLSQHISCPSCKKYALELTKVTQSDLNEQEFYKEYTCSVCGYVARMWYKLTFSHHEVVNDPKRIAAKMIPVESSVIAAIGYDRSKVTLYIQFVSQDKIYIYPGVSQDVFVDFLNAPRKGVFYNDCIRGRFTSTNSKRAN